MTETKHALFWPGVTVSGVPYAKDPLADFRRFLWVVWRHLNLPEPTPLQYDIANTLQRAAWAAEGDEDLRRLIIEAFRGVGKSWITSAFVVWLLYMNPQLKILVVSASKIRADDFTTFTLRLIKEIPVLAPLIPQEDQRQSKISFDVGPATAAHAPSVKSAGITGQLSGSRAHVIVPDDIEVPNNSATQGMRDKLAEAVKEFDAILNPGGRIIYLGTPQTEMSIYNGLGQRGYKTLIWPGRIPSLKQLEAYGNKLAPYIRKLISRGAPVGTSTDPRRFTDVDLHERELSYGRSGFALQFMLDTSLSDAERYPLRLSDLVVMDLHPELAPETVIWASGPNQVDDELPAVGFPGDKYHRPLQLGDKWVPYKGAVMTIDPAGKGEDEVGYAVVKMLNANLFVPACSGLRGGYRDENLRFLAQLAKDHRVNLIKIESNFGQGMFGELLKPHLRAVGYPCTIEEERAKVQKEARIVETLEPVMNQHRLVFDRKVILEDFRSGSREGIPAEKVLAYQLAYQMTRMTRERGAVLHEDRVDALEMAVRYWVELMGLDQREEERKAATERMEEEVRKTLKAAELGLAVMLGREEPKRASVWASRRA